ncbi:tyrosine-type recombinase/integrase, partial [Salmonella enterica]|nr:tyrosine-type recombinase/integrase [Salmonella enterica]
HFHDLRHEAISRLFELGTLNVMEVAAISGHKSLNMLKRYTHLRAYQLVSKLDTRRRQSQKIATYFVPYPAILEEAGDVFRVHLHDFEGMSVSGDTRESAMDTASVVLLRTLATAAQRGERVPRPGDLPLNAGVMINPLAGSVPVCV